MSHIYTVQEKETLAQIARAEGFHVKTLIHANPKIFPIMNPDVLAPGTLITIPDKKEKKVTQMTGTFATYTALRPAPQYLALTLDDPHETIYSVELWINGASVPIKEEKEPLKRKISTVDPLPEGNISSASLKLKLLSELSEQKTDYEIVLEIGGSDPILDPDCDLSKEADNIAPRKAVQKILKNLGYYTGNIDGDLEAPETYWAIARFQSDCMNMDDYTGSFGVANHKTCVLLVSKQGNQMGLVQPLKNGGR